MSKTLYLRIEDGKFVERNREASVVHDFKSITGHLVAVSYSECNKIDLVKLHIVDADSFYMLSLLATSILGLHVLAALPVADLHQSITIELMDVGRFSKCFLKQNGHVVPIVGDAPGFQTVDLRSMDRNARAKYIVDQALKSHVEQVLSRKINPFPYHPIYRPRKQHGLHTGYFDAQESSVRVVRPMSSFERNDENYGRR